MAAILISVNVIILKLMLAIIEESIYELIAVGCLEVRSASFVWQLIDAPPIVGTSYELKKRKF